MSAVQGGKGSGQRPGPGRNPTQAKRPQPRASQGKRPPAPGKRPQGKPPPGGRGGGKAGAPRQNMRITSAPPRRFSPTTIAFVSVGVVVVIVLALVIVKVAGGGSINTNATAPTRFPAPASLVSQVTSVPDSIAGAVLTPSGVSAPSVVKNQPALTSNGKPEVLFIGAEFCPLCGAERWAVIMTMAKFGTFSGLSETTSSPWDTPPAVSTFSFYQSTYTSPYVDFVTVEHETNDTHGLGTRGILQRLTQGESNLWTHYSQLLGIRTGYPFMDFGNKAFVTGPSYDPTVLEGLSHQEIASRLSNPQDPVTQGIVGTSNYLTASVCALTGQQPASVCSTNAVHQAATKLHLS